MTPERDDPIIDTLLEEVLGGRTPPDLSPRIMQALAMRGVRSEGSAASPNGNGAHLPQPPVVAPPPLPSIVSAATAPTPPAGQPVVSLRPSRPARKSSRSQWQMFAAAAAVVLLGVSLGVLAIVSSQNAGRHPGPVVKGPGSKGNPPAKNNELVTKPGPAISPKHNKGPDESQFAVTPPGPNESTRPTVPEATPENPGRVPLVPAVAVDRYGKASPDKEIISFVSAELQRSWTENQVNPAPLASDGEWCRRLFVRLLGRIPTYDETTAFLKDSAKDKREKLVDKLLTDEKYNDEYARYWATVWANVLIGRTTGTQDNSPVDRAAFEEYLRASLAANKPYDKLVHELLTATGSPKPGAPDFNGAVNFALAGLNENATLVTARTSRVFLGQQLQCAQCHQHPSQDWSQHDYWALNSFFRQMQVEKDASGVRVVNADFHGRKGVTEDGEVYYQLPNGQMKAAEPQFIDGTKVPPSGLLSEFDRREALAQLIVQSEYLPKALVNRLWSHFFGYGFTRPVDDMGKTNVPSHPEILDRLTSEFVTHQYDLKAAIRWIVLSDSFARSSQIPVGSLADSPEAGTAPLFSHYYTRQMQAEEVYNSLLAAANLRSKSGENADVLAQARVDWLAQFNRPMGTDDGQEESHFGGIRQSLEMFSGNLVRQASGSEHEGFLRGVARSEMPLPEKIEHLFLAALSRKPTPRESAATQKIVASAKDNAAALEDIWWALLNSNEFILDH